MTSNANPASDTPRGAGHLLWLDGEMTGLRYRTDLILELAVQVTTDDDPLTVIDSYDTLVAHHARRWPDEIAPIVQEMHLANGLWAEIEAARKSAVGLREADVAEALGGFIAEWPQARLAGDGQHFDWRMICHQWGEHIFEPLHYRQVDVSQLRQHWLAVERRTGVNGLVYNPPPELADRHRARSDLDMYRRALAHYQRLMDVLAHGRALAPPESKD